MPVTQESVCLKRLNLGIPLDVAGALGMQRFTGMPQLKPRELAKLFAFNFSIQEGSM